MKHLRVLNKEGVLIADNLLPECISCFNNCEKHGQVINVCPKYGTQRKQGKIINNSSFTFLCCDKTKTIKLFKEKMEALSYAYSDLIIPIEEMKKSEQQKVNRLVHNLTSINAHNIQEIYNFVPQDILASNWKNQLSFIEKELKQDSSEAAKMFLRLAKNSIHMKSEFSIYQKLDRNDTASLVIGNYSIRRVLLNVLHTFFNDFSNNGVYVNVAEYTRKVQFDYESIQVALYHLIENATKYVMPYSVVEIDFQEINNSIFVRFIMNSTLIKENERDLVFTEGYSGEISRHMKKNGDGIGMWRIKQMMKLNGGDCIVQCEDDIYIYEGYEYSKNTFILVFKK